MDGERPLSGAPSLRALLARTHAAGPRLGRTRLVGIDGPAGSGKTTLAGRLAETLGPATVVVHLDDLYAGWTLTGAVARLCAGVLAPLAEGRPGAYARYDWDAGRFEPSAVVVPTAPDLVVEGCGSCPRLLDPWTSLRIWVEAPLAAAGGGGVHRSGHAGPRRRRDRRDLAAVTAAGSLPGRPAGCGAWITGGPAAPGRGGSR